MKTLPFTALLSAGALALVSCQKDSDTAPASPSTEAGTTMTVIIDTISPGEWSGSSSLLLYTMAIPQITQSVLSEGIVIVQVYTNNAWVGLPGNIIFGQHLGLYEYQYWLNNARLRCNVVNGGPPAVDVIVKVTVMA